MFLIVRGVELVNYNAVKIDNSENRNQFNSGNEFQNKEFADEIGFEIYNSIGRSTDGHTKDIPHKATFNGQEYTVDFNWKGRA